MIKPAAKKAPRGGGAPRIYNDLRRRIIDLELAPGAALNPISEHRT